MSFLLFVLSMTSTLVFLQWLTRGPAPDGQRNHYHVIHACRHGYRFVWCPR
jgi:hypothetical protein